MFRTVLQEHPTGCGVACVAMLAGVPYAQAEAAMREIGLWGPRSRGRYTRYRDLVAGLERLGIPCRAARCRDLEAIATAAIVGVRTGSRRHFHWVVARRTDAGTLAIHDPLLASVQPCAAYRARLRRGAFAVQALTAL